MTTGPEAKGLTAGESNPSPPARIDRTSGKVARTGYGPSLFSLVLSILLGIATHRRFVRERLAS